MSAVLSHTSSTGIWQRAIQPSRGNLGEAAAGALLSLKLSKRDLSRADVLSAKANQGSLSDAEARELEDYRSVGTALEFLKSKARLSLRSERKAA